LLLTGLVVVTALSARNATGQDAKAADPAARIAALEKRVSKLEADLEAARKRPANPKQSPERKVLLVPLGRNNPRTAVKVLRAVYGDRPEFTAIRLNEIDAILLSGDEQTVDEALKLLKMMEPYGKKK